MIFDLIHKAAAEHPHKTALVAHAARCTYSELLAASARFAQDLADLGFQRGDRVAVIADNSANSAIAVLATLQSGGVLIPIHAALRSDAAQKVVQHADPHWVVQGAALAISKAEATLDRQPSLAAILYTSGSTGEPKGVMLTAENMQAALRSVNAYLKVLESDVVYSALPLTSSYGLYQLLLTLSVGATLVLDRSFSFPAKSLALLAAERATVFAGVPTQYAWLANTPLISQHDLSHIRLMTSAAAALPVEHARGVRTLFPNARLFIMYGQTECKRITYLDPDDFPSRPDSVGRGMPFQDHAVIDEEGRAVAAGEVGELVVQGPHVMQGYWRDSDGTAQRLRPIADRSGNWLHTNDLFRIDADGFLYFLGRRDDILKIGGNKVSPREIEEVLCQMPEISEAAVVGMPDATWGEAACAHVVLKPDAQCSAEDVIRFCTPRLRGFMVPKKVVFARALPKTESGKIKKRALV